MYFFISSWEPRSQNRIVTASSVCLPPLIEHGTLQCYVTGIERDSFQANVIRAMIAYFDSFHSNKIWQSVSTVLAIEKLVSFLANASNEHQTVITNASSLLARIVKGNDILMKKNVEICVEWKLCWIWGVVVKSDLALVQPGFTTTLLCNSLLKYSIEKFS